MSFAEDYAYVCVLFSQMAILLPVCILPEIVYFMSALLLLTKSKTADEGKQKSSH